MLNRLARYLASLFIIWLMVMIPVDVADALLFSRTPTLSEIAHDGVVILWSSDVMTKGTVFYGIDAPTQSVSSENDTTSHRMVLAGLLPATTYYFYATIEAENETKQYPIGDDYPTFTTAPPLDEEPPHAPIELAVDKAGSTSLTISWGKDPADTDIDSYKIYLDGEYQTTTKVRSFSAANLESETEYELGVLAVDTSGNEGPQATVKGTTLSENIRDIFIGKTELEVLGTEIQMSWKTDFPTNAAVHYGIKDEMVNETDKSFMNQLVTIDTFNTSQSVIIDNLEEGTTYSIYVTACDEYNNCVDGVQRDFETGIIVELFLELEQPKINLTDSETFFYHNTYEINVIGRSAPYSDVNLYINGQKKRFKRLYDKSKFLFNGVDLDPKLGENIFKLQATSRKGEEIIIEKTIIVDRFPPEITNITIPEFTAESSVKITGNISDDSEVTVNMYLLKNSLAFHLNTDLQETFPDYYLDQGPQTRLVYEVKIVAQEIMNGSTDRETVQNIFSWMQENIASGCGDSSPASRSRPAKSILQEKCAVDHVDNTIAFIALARTLGIPAKYIETAESEWAICAYTHSITSDSCGAPKLHSFSEVYLADEGLWLQVDPAVHAFTEKDMAGHFRSVSASKEAVLLTFGYDLDSWRLGIDDDSSMKIELEQGLLLGYSDEQIKSFIASDKIYKSGDFTLMLGPLEEGEKNQISLEFVDQAGNMVQFDRVITYDTTPPRIMMPTTLEPYTPTYVYEIEIPVQVDDVSNVYVFVNEKNIDNLDNAQTKVRTDDNGTVVVPIKLSFIGGSYSANGTSASAGVQAGLPLPVASPGPGISSHITIVAVDDAGQKSDPLEGDITYGQCTEGSDWKITITSASPSRLNTRELLEGLASFGAAFNFTWQGPGNPQYAQITGVNVRSAPLGTAYEATQYDKASDYLRTPMQVVLGKNGSTGIFIANFNPVPTAGNTTYEKEKNISDRGKNGKCLIPKVGCFKFLFVLEISYIYSEPTDSGPFGYQSGNTQQQVGIPPRTLQKHCFPVEIIIDERFDPSDIPKSFLKATVDFLNNTIYIIESILGPLTTVTKYVLIGCLISWIAMFVMNIKKQFTCKWSSVLSKPDIASIIKTATGRSDFVHAAEQGLCEVRFADDKEDSIREACNSCSESTETYWKVRWGNRFLCDRVICPSVPSFQHYIKTKGGGTANLGKAMNLKTSSYFKNPTALANFITPDDVKNGAGSSIGEKGSDIRNQLNIKHDCSLVEKRGAKEIAKIWDAWKKNEKELSTECAKPHPNQAACCAATYMEDWKWGAVFIDPLKQSLCLANPGHSECSLGTRVVNGIVGICEPNNKQTRIQTADNLRYTPDYVADRGIEPLGNVVYLIEYEEDGTTLSRVCRGYIKKQYNIQSGEVTNSKNFVPVVSDNGFMCQSSNLADAFDQANPADPDSDEPADKDAYNIFASDLKGVGLGFSGSTVIRRKYSGQHGSGYSGSTGNVVLGITGYAETDEKLDIPISGYLGVDDDGKDVYADEYNDLQKYKPLPEGAVFEEKAEGKVKRPGEVTTSTETDCPTKRQIPSAQQGKGSKYKGESCCRPGLMWDDLRKECVIDESDCPAEQVNQKNPTLCCGSGELWDRTTQDCEKSKYAQLDAKQYGLRESDIREAYERIAGEVGTVDQVYILQPKDSIVQALIGLCLTAIRMFLLQFLRILKRLKMCFEAILYTGDGAAGQCEAIVSQYICDLLIEAISCFMRRFAGQGPTGESSGVGNFLGAVSDANTEVMGDITGRYGEDNIFTEQFSTSSIMKGVCIFAFTGEWPSNFGALLDSAMQVPVASFASVYPAERRFQAFDIEGNPVFTYHIGLSFFAGAPTRARLELICSGEGYDCPENGRQFNKCDCVEMGEKILSVPLSAASCKPSCQDTFNFDQDCSTECFLKVERTPYRYDRARVVWEYTGGQTTAGIGGPVQGMVAPNPESLSGHEEHRINEIAGPPGGICHFDGIELRYTCGTDPMPEMYGRIANIQLAAPIGQQSGQEPVYQIGDSHIFNLDVVVKTPENMLERCQLGTCEATKYLAVVIRNRKGAVVWPPDYTARPSSASSGVGTGGASGAPRPPTQEPSVTLDLPPALRLNGNQRFHMAFYDGVDFGNLGSLDPFASGFEIKREMFDASISSVTSSGTVAGSSYGTGSNCYPMTCEVPISCMNIDAKYLDKDEGVQINAGAGKITLQRRRIENNKNIAPIGNEIACTQTGKEVTCGTDFKFNVMTDENLTALKGTSGAGAACVISFKKPATPTTPGGETGAGVCDPLSPQQWTAEVMMFNSQADGTSWRMSPQITVGPDGRQQRFKIPFKVVCGTARTTSSNADGTIKDIGNKAVTFTAEQKSDYGVTVDGLAGEESVVLANYAPYGGAGFEIDILVEALLADIRIDISKLNWNVLTVPLTVTKLDTSESIYECTEGVDGPNGPQPRPCYTKSSNGAYLTMHMKRGDPRFRFSGFQGTTYNVVEEGGNCKPPYSTGVCVDEDMWSCLNETDVSAENEGLAAYEFTEVDFAARHSCIGEDCCGTGSRLVCCPTGNVRPLHGTCGDNFGLCIDTNSFKCLEGTPKITSATGENYGFGTGEGTAINTKKDDSCTIPAEGNKAIQCCESGNYKYARKESVKTGVKGSGESSTGIKKTIPCDAAYTCGEPAGCLCECGSQSCEIPAGMGCDTNVCADLEDKKISCDMSCALETGCLCECLSDKCLIKSGENCPGACIGAEPVDTGTSLLDVLNCCDGGFYYSDAPDQAGLVDIARMWYKHSGSGVWLWTFDKSVWYSTTVYKGKSFSGDIVDLVPTNLQKVKYLENNRPIPDSTSSSGSVADYQQQIDSSIGGPGIY